MIKRTIRFDNGKEVAILKDNGRFYICEDGSQYSKANRHIMEIKREKVDEEMVEEKPIRYLHNVVVPEDTEEEPKTEDKKAQKKTASKSKTEKKSKGE